MNTQPAFKSPFLSAIKNEGQTENNCVTNLTSSKHCVDLFFKIGAMRNAEKSVIHTMLYNALEENPTDALRILFYARDVRGGQGERNVFKAGLEMLTSLSTPLKLDIVRKIPEYGRWKDLFHLFGTKDEAQAITVLTEGLAAGDPLCAKWCPREKSAHKHIAKKLRKALNLSAKEYRKLLSSATSVVETQMCNGEWGAINFSHVPSQAMLKYRKAFSKRDTERFVQYLADVADGTEEIKASTLHPHQIVSKIMSGDSDPTFGAQWNALPNYMEGCEDRRILPLIDVSGSMMGLPITVAIGLGMYLAERNTGAFKDHFITYSENPQLQMLVGKTLEDRVNNLQGTDWGYNTNLQAVFNLILNKAVGHRIPESEMPTEIIILSDMEFDEACDNRQTAFDSISFKFKQAGYEMPSIIFWNLNSRTQDNYPVKFDEQGTALVSGFSPSIMKHILSNKGEITPEMMMRLVLDSPRYSCLSF